MFLLSGVPDSKIISSVVFCYLNVLFLRVNPQLRPHVCFVVYVGIRTVISFVRSVWIIDALSIIDTSDSCNVGLLHVKNTKSSEISSKENPPPPTDVDAVINKSLCSVAILSLGTDLTF